jgi:methionine synthase I (cobalamin-dependent)
MAAMSFNLLDRLGHGPPLVMDGAMGTELIRTGSDCGGNLARLNLTRPELVLNVHRAYVAAGARVILTNTFQANPVAITDPMELQQVGKAAVDLARQAGADYILADIGPIITSRYTECENPDDLCRAAEAIAGTDGILLETCSSIQALPAIEQLRRAMGELPILLSLAFCHRPEGLVTYDGHSPDWFAERVHDSGVDALGVNCGLEISPGDCIEIIRRYRALTNLPLFARPNAGTPKLVAQGGMIYPRSIMEFAAAGRGLVDAGAVMIGGCCGTTPAHIAAMCEQIKTPGPD